MHLDASRKSGKELDIHAKRVDGVDLSLGLEKAKKAPRL